MQKRRRWPNGAGKSNCTPIHLDLHFGWYFIRYHKHLLCRALVTDDGSKSRGSAAWFNGDQEVIQIYKSEANPDPSPELESRAAELVAYNGIVEHIFFHPLITYPKLAFDSDSLSKGYNDWFTTVPEFKRILESLYKKGFILVHLEDVFEEKTVDGRKIIGKRTLMLPKGKKPLVISIDDLNYYSYMIDNGNVFKLVLDAEGK